MTRAVTFDATAEDAGLRLDVAVSRRVDRSRTTCALLIRGRHVRVNGVPAKASYALAAGDHVVVEVPPPTEPDARPEAIPIHIVYRDHDLCVVDKPAGMATHPAPGSTHGTLVNALLAALGPLPSINGALRPGIVHRLDKDTSGLLVVAVSEQAMRGLSLEMAERKIEREYDAVVWGRLAQERGVIDAPIGRDPNDRTKFAVRENGRRAVTQYRAAETFTLRPTEHQRRTTPPETLALIQLKLETGRTHQIRVHCAAIGHPIVGDRTYGGGRPALGMMRQALHAARLRFTHPITGKAMSFTAPWPEDFAELVERLRVAAPA
jgi:23S rRNA pseudouridine1911/1915/1917 synthase